MTDKELIKNVSETVSEFVERYKKRSADIKSYESTMELYIPKEREKMAGKLRDMKQAQKHDVEKYHDTVLEFLDDYRAERNQTPPTDIKQINPIIFNLLDIYRANSNARSVVELFNSANPSEQNVIREYCKANSWSIPQLHQQPQTQLADSIQNVIDTGAWQTCQSNVISRMLNVISSDFDV